jgi:predicted  nucleic acid-binding Zn-ribbon protein
MRRRSNTLEDPLILEAALEGLELQKHRIESQIDDIRSRLKKHPKPISSEDVVPAKRNLSSEARKRIATAQKKRWAEYRKSNATPK